MFSYTYTYKYTILLFVIEATMSNTTLRGKASMAFTYWMATKATITYSSIDQTYVTQRSTIDTQPINNSIKQRSTIDNTNR